ncbi:MAG: hypothetical protein HRF45_02220 [Fimbriimonadia bacterium]|jgi:hypothetical protein
MVGLLVAALSLSTPLDDAAAQALSLAGLTTETARFDQNLLRFFDFDEFVLGSFNAYWEAPWRIPTFETGMTQRIVAAMAKPSEIVMLTGWQIGIGTRRTLLGNPIASMEQSAEQSPDFASALAAVDAFAGGDGNVERFRAGAEAVPKEVAKAVTLLATAASAVVKAREVTFDAADGAAKAWETLTRGDDESFAAVERSLRSARAVDIRYMTSAATDLTMACEKAAEWLRAAPKADFRYEVETALGWVCLRGAGSDTYEARPYFLIMDLAGDDTYLGGAANTSAQNGISLLFDLEGNDRYLSDQALAGATVAESPLRTKGGSVPTSGGALCGVSVLFDLGGDDLYRSVAMGQGAAHYGVAVLWDTAGNDTYDGYARCQGFAEHGVGVLLDTTGNDAYSCFNLAQGCGRMRGFGLLADGAGNDRYEANDTILDFAASQTKDHNTSMAQGCGFGRRADYSDGHSLGGGFGVLCDVSGDDRYSCGVFGQGVGYWKAVGLLADLAGNDVYQGIWYVQGACAHFAIGILHDYEGDDQYEATMNMAQGAGHDFSIGLLLDGAGNDRYRAPNLSLGAGNANGIGIFVDFAGADEYRSSGTTLGKANASTGGVRDIAICLGVFMDLGGNDSYPDGSPWAKNGAEVVNWTTQRAKPSESQVGVFLDRQ